MKLYSSKSVIYSTNTKSLIWGSKVTVENRIRLQSLEASRRALIKQKHRMKPRNTEWGRKTVIRRELNTVVEKAEMLTKTVLQKPPSLKQIWVRSIIDMLTCVWVDMCVPDCLHIYAHQRTEVDSGRLSPPIFTLCFETVFPWSSLSQLGWPTKEFQRSACPLALGLQRLSASPNLCVSAVG